MTNEDRPGPGNPVAVILGAVRLVWRKLVEWLRP